MRECFKCGKKMIQVNGCSDQRTISFADGEDADPIPFGDGKRTRTYQEMIQNYKREIKNGGRGELGEERIRKELEAFTTRWDEESYKKRRCHDCGARVGEYHHPGCDSEECPRCGGQYFICECDTEEKRQIWNE